MRLADILHRLGNPKHDGRTLSAVIAQGKARRSGWRVMTVWLAALCLLACFPTPTSAAQGEATVFRNARVFDGARVLPQTVVVIQDGRIVAVGAQAEAPAGKFSLQLDDVQIK
jgi:hypothetical protein